MIGTNKSYDGLPRPPQFRTSGLSTSTALEGHRTGLLLFLLLVLTVATNGCGSGTPRAPALSNDPVYNNRREGFRFLVPDGWNQQASSVLPLGKLEGENLLVKYTIKSPEGGAYLEVICFDASVKRDLHRYHAGESHGLRRWDSKADPEEMKFEGKSGHRYIYQGQMNKRSMTKEVVVFRRGERVYSFIGLFWSDDTKGQQQIRRAVKSVKWTK